MYHFLLISVLENYLEKLNEQQRKAVIYTDGPQLVIAGAGSGKTRVLTYKIVHLLTLGYSPGNIMALTFTNKAAREMKERIAPLVGLENASRLWMGTFHSIFSKILHINAEKLGFKSNFTIYDTDDSKSLIKLIIKDMNLDDKIYKPSAVQSHISRLKNALISPVNYELDSNLRKADERTNRPAMFAIYKAYFNRCRIAEAMDFDDLLYYTNILLRDNPDVLEKYQDIFKYVLVDEYQDTNFAQHMIVSQLCRKSGKLCVVGDDAQSIYSFRGANIGNILNLDKYYPGIATFKLEQNYRSTQLIIKAANSLIDKNTEQIRKNIFSCNSQGEPVSLMGTSSDIEESYAVANYIVFKKAQQGGAFEDFAILYRTNAQSRSLEEALRKRNIPYSIYGGLSFYQRKEIKDAVAYFRLTTNPSDDEALLRIINTPARGIGDTTKQKLQQSAFQNGVSIWEVISNIDKYSVNINAGTKGKLSKFQNKIEKFITAHNAGMSAFELAKFIIEDTELISSLLSFNTPENISKVENLNELLNAVSSFSEERREEENEKASLNDFLNEISLATDEDKNSDGGKCVKLMTVHASKGLEFKNVIIVGVEEELFPATMSTDSIYGIEEERRLLYVAITRAEATCLITYAKHRFKNGTQKDCVPSRFIRDIDSSLLNTNTSTRADSYSPRHNDRFRDRFDDYTGSFNDSFGKGGEPRFSNSIGDRSRNESRHSTAGDSFGTRFNQQSAKPLNVRVTPANTSASSGNYEIHQADELTSGTRIEHIRFGIGVVSKVDTSGSDSKIVVEFDEVGSKTLLLKYAKFVIL